MPFHFPTDLLWRLLLPKQRLLTRRPRTTHGSAPPGLQSETWKCLPLLVDRLLPNRLPMKLCDLCTYALQNMPKSVCLHCLGFDATFAMQQLLSPRQHHPSPLSLPRWLKDKLQCTLQTDASQPCLADSKRCWRRTHLSDVGIRGMTYLRPASSCAVGQGQRDTPGSTAGTQHRDNRKAGLCLCSTRLLAGTVLFCGFRSTRNITAGALRAFLTPTLW